MNQELQDYIKKSKEGGLNDEQIKQELLKAGWQERDINLEFAESVSSPAPAPSPYLFPSPSPSLSPESYSEQPEQKKSSKLTTIILVVVPVILIIAGGALAYNYLFKPLGDKIINQNDNQQDNATEIAKNETQKEEVKDCGSVVNTHIAIYPEQMTQQEENSIKCMNEAFSSCSLAKFELSEGKIEGPYADQNTGGSYEIKGREGERCIMTSSIYKPPSSKTCKVPMSFISLMKAEAERTGQPDSLFITATFGIFLAEYYNEPGTGKTISFECR